MAPGKHAAGPPGGVAGVCRSLRAARRPHLWRVRLGTLAIPPRPDPMIWGLASPSLFLFFLSLFTGIFFVWGRAEKSVIAIHPLSLQAPLPSHG